MSNIVGKIRPLIDKDGNYVFPETSVDAVYFPDGTTVSEKLDETVFFDEDVDTIEIEKADGVKRLDNLESSVSGITSQLDTIAINVDSLGAKGDGYSNDTEIINKALENLKKSEKLILSPNKIYMVDQLNIPSDTVFDFNGGIIKKITCSDNSYRILNINNVENITLINPILVGDRETHIGVTGEWGHGIEILESNNIKIYNPTISQCWGDGIYIGGNTKPSENINIIGTSNIKKCRRQGVSIVYAKNVNMDILNISDIDGTAPMCAIDIEANTQNDILENISINTINAHNCNGALSVVGKGGLLSNINVDTINIVNAKTYPLSFFYSNSNDTTELNNIDSVVNINNVYIKSSIREVVKFGEYIIGKVPRVYIKNILLDSFEYGTGLDDTVDKAIITIVSTRNESKYLNVGGINIDNIIVNKANVDFYFTTFINRSTSSFILEDVKINNTIYNSNNINILNNNFNYLKINNVFVANHKLNNILTSSDFIIKDGHNIAKTNLLRLTWYVKNATILSKMDYIKFEKHSSIADYKVFINGVETTNFSNIYNMMNVTIYIYVDEINKTINILYTNYLTLYRSSSKLTNPVGGEIQYYSNANKVIYYTGSKWIDMMGNDITN